uniref:Uncharacterized protein n=1 Tax=Arundo donax TaxID=35708 RepID=A0A0A9AY92_ARUDO
MPRGFGVRLGDWSGCKGKMARIGGSHA